MHVSAVKYFHGNQVLSDRCMRGLNSAVGKISDCQPEGSYVLSDSILVDRG